MSDEVLGRLSPEGSFIFGEDNSTIVARIDDDGIVRLTRPRPHKCERCGGGPLNLVGQTLCPRCLDVDHGLRSALEELLTCARWAKQAHDEDSREGLGVALSKYDEAEAVCARTPSGGLAGEGSGT